MRFAFLPVVGLLLAVAGCADPPNGDGARELTVFAASSLTGSFTELGEQFETRHQGVEVRFNFDGSSNLAAQIAEGAPADVFASADAKTMDRVAQSGAVAGSPVVIATNTLRVVTPPGNPAGVTTLGDLAAPSVKTVVCAPQVPCGAATRALLEAAGVSVNPVSEEQSVADVLGKITNDTADAGLVYATDVIRAGESVESVEVDVAAGIVNRYPIAALDTATDAELARRFIDFVAGRDGRSVLAAAGFGAP